MFELYDRIRSYLLGLRDVQAQDLGNEEGFFYSPKGTRGLFCTLSNEAPLQIRFCLQGQKLPKDLLCQNVRGWPGWTQVCNPSPLHEEVLWSCITQAYQQTTARHLSPPMSFEGGRHVAYR